MIYHYTTAAGLQGIFEARQLHLTQSNFMNDPSEIIYSRRLCKELIETVSTEMNFRNRDALDNLLQFVEGTISDEYVYIFSCSNEPNSLALWNMYGKEDGYCLGIDEAQLIPQFRECFSNFTLLRYLGDNNVEYNKEQQTEKVTRFLRMYFNKFIREKWTIDHRAAVAARIMEMLPFFFWFKDECYQIEQEIRYIFCINNRIAKYEEEAFNAKVGFRNRNGKLIPYLRVPLSSFTFLQEVTLSPTNSSELSKEGLRQFLFKEKMSIPIKTSTLPYRII